MRQGCSRVGMKRCVYSVAVDATLADTSLELYTCQSVVCVLIVTMAAGPTIRCFSLKQKGLY